MMMPIHELLARIRWDSSFGHGLFMLGYIDHNTSELRFVPFNDVRPDTHNPSMLDFVDNRGGVVSVPLHRIYQVLRNGKTIWQRDLPPHVHASFPRGSV